MLLKRLKYISKCALIGLTLLLTTISSESYAVYEGVRDMRWNGNRCVGGGWNDSTKKSTSENLNFNPFSTNQDIEWELTNGVCIAYVARVAATLQGLKTVAGFACQNQMEGPVYAFSVSTGIPLSPKSIEDQVKDSTYCVQQSNLCGPQNPASCTNAALCCASTVSVYIGVAISVAALAITYGVANGTYQKSRICGYKGDTPWKTWNNDMVKGGHEGSYKQYLQNKYSSGALPKLDEQEYREFIFGGIEYEDKGDGACKAPNWTDSRKREILGYADGTNLKYYMTGSNEVPIFACYRFLLATGSDEEIKAGREAYDCCVKRSKSVVCIENAGNGLDPLTNKYEYTFCPIGSRCNVKGIWFDAYQAKTKQNYVCAKTYSVCPYNHPVGGGTEVYDADNTKNDCQYMNHCSILPISPYVTRSSLAGAFFDSSCKDLRGDSQNTYGYASNLVPVNVRGFSAPMAQCFKETIQNIFFNRAGSTSCIDPNETPDLNGECSSGFKYKKGESLSSYQKTLGQSGDSFLVRIQKSLQDSIKMALSIAIMFFGVSILIGDNLITKQKIVPLAVKIGVVMYFATGVEWQNWVVNGIIDGSAQLSDIMFRTESLTGTTQTEGELSDGTKIVKYVTDNSVDKSKLDGCQFPRYNYADPNESTRYNFGAYPPGKEYIRIWDTLDCKIARALGYGIEVSVPNLVMMILGGFLTGGAGIVFLLATFAFAFFLIALVIRALHIFVLSIMSIIILFYISPIMFTLFLFNKTKGMFEKWWKNIMGFALQPMILFAYLGIVLTFFDTVLIGDATFIGDGKSVPKQVVCSGEAVNKSIYCIFNPPVSGSNGSIKNNDQLKIIGIGLPVLANMNQTKVATLIKAAILFFILMSFMDKITDFAKTLVGGEGLSSNAMKASDMMKNAYGIASGVQRRGMGLLKKNLAPTAIRGGGFVRDKISDRVSSEKETKRAEYLGGRDVVGNDNAAVDGGLQGGDQGNTSGVESPPAVADNQNDPRNG